MENVIKGFKTKDGIAKVDFGSLANIPEKFPPEEHTHEDLEIETIEWEKIQNKPELKNMYVQAQEPTDAPEGSFWIDTDDFLDDIPDGDEVSY